MIDKRDLIKELIAEKKILETLFRRTQRQLEAAPEGRIRLVKHRNDVQFFFRETGNEKSGKYMPKKDHAKAYALIQKRYDQELLKVLQPQLELLNRFLAGFDPYALSKVYERSGELMQRFVKPAELPDNEFKEWWQAQPYEGKAFLDDAPVHLTSRGERVRSKSEVMIADAFLRYDLAYRYEYPLIIKGRTFHPDFTILRLSDRKEIYWEHVGLLDKGDYREDFLAKLRSYEEVGIYPGDRLILTFETAATPLNLRMINLNIKHYLL